jgi:membrane-associated protein
VSALASLQVDSLLSYAAAIVFPALDAVLPVLPSETIIITLGVATAGSADPRIALLVACAAAGAFLGDNLCYLLGRRFGPWIDRRFFRSEKGAKQRAWAIQSLERYGIPLIVACRFIPGGRTAVMLSCGIVRYDRRRFIIATAIAAVIWACYAFFIGRLGGKAFEDKPWAGLLLAFGGTLAITGLVELVRRLRARQVQRRSGTQGQGDAQGQGDTERQGDGERQGDAREQAGAQDHADTQRQGDAQSSADSQGRADSQSLADSQSQADDREHGTPSSDDVPRTPVR